jgi:hypothetical protein
LEPLILEIETRGLHRYHELSQAEIRVGRALDNDIILSDPTVEPYHLEILRHEDGRIELKNLATVNPAKFNGRQEDNYSTRTFPIDLNLGRISARILSATHQVAETKSLASNSRIMHLFGHSAWAVLLLALCFVVGAYEYYYTSYNTLKWDDLLKYVLRESVLSIAAIVVTLSILERLVVNRWETKPIIISVTLIYLLYQLLSLLTGQLMYLFSSDFPDSFLNLVWYLMFIPAAVSFHLIGVTHLRQSKAILLATMISSPFAILAIMASPTVNSFLDDFSSSANYQKSLSPLNWHLAKTVSITEFIEQASSLEPGEFSK